MSVWIVACLLALVMLHVLYVWFRSWRRGQQAHRRDQSLQPTTVANNAFAVSILVPAWNEEGTIEHCLRSLQAIDYCTAEVIVVAGGTDRTYEIASAWSFERFPYSVLQQPPGGKNAALASGLQVASGDVIVVLDADSVVHPDWLNRLLAPLASGADAVCGDYAPRRWTRISAFEQMEKAAANEVAEPVALQGSGSIAVFRAALTTCGGFPAAVKVGVDWDLGMRLRATGHTLAFAREAKLQTDRAATLSEFWRNEVRWRRAHLASVWNRRHWYSTRPLDALNACAFGLMALITGGVLVLPFVLWMISPVAALWSAIGAVIFLFWIGARRMSLVLLLVAYTGNRGWLRLWWVPTILMFASMLATLYGAITMSALSAQFKGPRSAELSPTET